MSFDRKTILALSGALFVLVAAQLLLILWLKPGYGVADDGTILLLCDRIQSHGLWNEFRNFVVGDRSWGMFRPSYFFMSQLLYCTTQPNTTLLYFCNALFVFSTLAICGFFFYSTIDKPSWSRKLFVLGFIFICLAIYRTHDLFSIVGMQEKLVLLAGSLAIGVFSYFPLKNKTRESFFSGTTEILLIVTLLILGFSTKAQFLLFLPGLFLILVQRTHKESSRFLFLLRIFLYAVCSIIGALLIKKIASAGLYTTGYSTTRILHNLQTRQAIYLIAISVSSIALELFFLKNKRFTVENICTVLLPASFPLSYLAIMAPWSISDSYLLASTAPLIAFCSLSVWQKISLQKTYQCFYVIIFIAFVMTLGRGYRNIGRYSDFNKILYSKELLQLTSGPHTLIMSCDEGANLIKVYTQRFLGKKINTVTKYSSDIPSQHSIMLLGDSALCPVDMALKQNLTRISTPLFKDSFALYKLR